MRGALTPAVYCFHSKISCFGSTCTLRKSARHRAIKSIRLFGSTGIVGNKRIGKVPCDWDGFPFWRGESRSRLNLNRFNRPASREHAKTYRPVRRPLDDLQGDVPRRLQNRLTVGAERNQSLWSCNELAANKTEKTTRVRGPIHSVHGREHSEFLQT